MSSKVEKSSYKNMTKCLKTHPNPFLPNGLTIFSQTIQMQWQRWTMAWIITISEGSILWNYKLKRCSGLLMHLFNIFMRFCTSLPKKTMKHHKKRKGKIFRALIFWYFTDELISLIKNHEWCPIFFGNLWPPNSSTDVRFIRIILDPLLPWNLGLKFP